jgi:allose kinase
MPRLVVGIDIGGTNLRIGLVDERLTVRSPQQVSSQLILGRETRLGNLADFLRLYLVENLLPDDQLVAISVGFPSTVDANRRTVISTSNIPGLQNIDVPNELAEFEVPILVDRDVNMLLRHDVRDLKLDAIPGVVFGCYIGTGLGSAFTVGGQILVGKHGVAGELGHVPFPGVTYVCGCGNIGCSETVASGSALERELKTFRPSVNIKEVFSQCSEELFIQRWIDYVAATMAAAINILDPTHIIVGGGVVAMKDFPRQRMEAALVKVVRKPLPASDLNLHYARSSQHSGILGAAIYAFESHDHIAGTPDRVEQQSPVLVKG